MEKTFRRLLSQREYRDAYAEAGAATHLAHQIRVLRIQRGWSQAELARRLGTTQGVVSRLEDSGYGRVSFKTLVSLARAFDVMPVMGFASLAETMRKRWAPQREDLEVQPFEAEALHVVFLSGSAAGPAAGYTTLTGQAHAEIDTPLTWATDIKVVIHKPTKQTA
jgi:transcriptional regulator with XRE-family HTH domain